MKFQSHEQGNMMLNALVVVALFVIAYVWYANQPTQEASEVTEENETIEMSEDNTDAIETENVATEVVNTLQNIVPKNTKANEEKNLSNDPVPTPLNSVLLSETETGNFVTIGYANLTRPGFIAIYKVNSNSETILVGQTDLLPPTIITNLKIEINTVIAEDQTIVAVLHQDDGDGIFKFPESDPYLKNADGMIVSDVDVVDVRFEREAKGLRDQINTYLERNFE